jgi:hypothetical protein
MFTPQSEAERTMQFVCAPIVTPANRCHDWGSNRSANVGNDEKLFFESMNK